MKTLSIVIIAAVSFGALVGDSLAYPMPAGTESATGQADGEENLFKGKLNIASLTVDPPQNLLRGSIVNSAQYTARVGYTISRVVGQRLIPLNAGKISIAAGKTGDVTASLDSTATSGQFRMTITDPDGKVCDVKNVTLTQSSTSPLPYVVKYRTLGGSRVVLGQTLAKSVADRDETEKGFKTQASFLESCGFTTEIDMTYEYPTPNAPIQFFNISLFAQLELMQSRRFESMTDAQKFADEIRPCIAKDSGVNIEIQVQKELKKCRE